MDKDERKGMGETIGGAGARKKIAGEAKPEPHERHLPDVVGDEGGGGTSGGGEPFALSGAISKEDEKKRRERQRKRRR